VSPNLWTLWAGVLLVGCGLAVLAGIITRKRRAHRVPPSKEVEDAIQAIRSEVERIAQFGKSTNKNLRIMGDAVIALIKENRTRFDHLQNHTEELDGCINEQGHHVRSIGGAIGENSEKIRQIDGDVRELSTRVSETIEGLSQIRKNMDQRLSENAEIKRVSLDALAGRVDTLSPQADAFAKDYADSSDSLKSLAESDAALIADAAGIKNELEKHVLSIQSDLADLAARLKSAESSIDELRRGSNGQLQPGQSVFRVVRPS
jgi:chromosome segregation ATPase